MKIITENDRYCCVLLEHKPLSPEEDALLWNNEDALSQARVRLQDDHNYEIYHIAKTACHQDKRPGDETIPDLIHIQEATKTYQKSFHYWSFGWIFKKDYSKTFVLLEKDGPTTGAVAGYAELDSSCGYSSELHVLSSHRGQHLSDLLHRARLLHVFRDTEFDYAHLDIEAGNNRSIRSAERNGYVAQIYKEPLYLTFGRQLFRIPKPKIAGPDITRYQHDLTALRGYHIQNRHDDPDFAFECQRIEYGGPAP